MLGDAGGDSGPYPPSVSSQFDTVNSIVEKIRKWQSLPQVFAQVSAAYHKSDLFHGLYHQFQDDHNLKASEGALYIGGS